MTSVIKVDNIQNSTGATALSIDSSGNLTTSQLVLAHVVMTGDQNDKSEQTWNKMKWDSAIIDTKSGFDNSNERYTIPVAGYYRIYVQALLGVLGESNSARDTGLCVTRTRNGTETEIALSTNRHYNGSNDTSDATETIHVIDNCQVGDHIQFYTFVNTDTGTAYDVFANVDANDNTHMNNNLPSGSSEGNPITYFIIERISG